jgi:hypothetical protein
MPIHDETAIDETAIDKMSSLLFVVVSRAFQISFSSGLWTKVC